MTAMTKRDAVDAALSVAQDAAEGRLDLTALQEQAVAECRELFNTIEHVCQKMSVGVWGDELSTDRILSTARAGMTGMSIRTRWARE